MTGRSRGARAERAGDVVAWGVAEAPMPDEPESGDRYVVQPAADGALIAVVDGLGHGPAAAAAAKIAVATLEAYTHESPLGLVLRCHEELRGTRGAVMTLAFFHTRDRTLTWLGVGNVEAALFSVSTQEFGQAERAPLRPGVLGHQLPVLRAKVLPLRPFDTLVVATDGIKPDFTDTLVLDGDPQQIADRILAQHGKGTDDALVVVARYLGDEPL